MEQNSVLYSKRSGKDFSRKSKLSFAKTVSILLAMQGKTISDELLNFFDYKLDTPSASAFVQARNKLDRNTMQTLFHRFVSTSEVHETYKGFRLLAADGSEFSIPQNKDALHRTFSEIQSHKMAKIKNATNQAKYFFKFAQFVSKTS